MEQFVTNYPDAVVLKSEKRDDTNELKTYANLLISICNYIDLTLFCFSIDIFRFDFNGLQNIELIIHRLDINKYMNYLQINFSKFAYNRNDILYNLLLIFIFNYFHFPASTLNESKSFYFTEFIEAPKVKTITFDNVRQLRIAYDFSKSESDRYLGYVLSYRLSGIIHSPLPVLVVLNVCISSDTLTFSSSGTLTLSRRN